MTIGHTLIGSGENRVIVLHGWFGDHTEFEPTFNYLDRANFTYAFIDHRGYGKSKDIKGDYSISEMAGDVIELAEELGWHEFHLVGHSMGGMVAQRIMVDINDADRVKSIVAITPVPACGVPFDKSSAALFYGAVNSDKDRRNILDFTTGNRNSIAWLDFMVNNCRDTTTVEAYAAYLDAWSKTNFTDEVIGNKTPVCVCIGEFDPAFTKNAMEQTYLNWLPNSELSVMSNAGHYPMLETPVQIVTVMEAFMEKHGEIEQTEIKNNQTTAIA